ncbi:MAG: glycosyltransferase family 2 protein [Cetobacterium sp.]
MNGISVIIPTYNRKNKVLKAIYSILEQEYENYEIIVVDDGSTDGTKEEIKKIKNKRISYFFKENGGAASAKNYGAKNSNYNFILFLDSDDYLENKYILKLINSKLSKNDFISFRKIKTIYNKNNTIVSEIDKIENIKEHMLNLPLNYAGYPPYILNKQLFFQAECFDEDFKWGEALGFWRRYFKYVKNSVMIDEIGYVYCLNGDDHVSKGGKNNKNKLNKLKLETIKKSFIESKSQLNNFQQLNWIIILIYISLLDKDIVELKNMLKKLRKYSLKEIYTSFKYIYQQKVLKKGEKKIIV